MTTVQIQKQILSYLQGLPEDALKDIVSYIKGIRAKKIKKKTDNIDQALYKLNETEAQHLEEEFVDYKKLYPHE